MSHFTALPATRVPSDSVLSGARRGIRFALVASAVGLVVAVLSGCASGAAPEASGAADASATAPNVEGLPDVVATVNGQSIGLEEFTTVYTAEFADMVKRAQTAGEAIDQARMREQAVNGMINTQLLVEEATGRGITVAQADIDAQLNEVATQQGLASGEEFLASAEAQGISRDIIVSQLTTQISVDRLLTQEVGDTEPADDELRALYDVLVAQGASGAGASAQPVPAFEDVRPQLIEQAKVERKSAAAQAIIDTKRQTATIEILL